MRHLDISARIQGNRLAALCFAGIIVGSFTVLSSLHSNFFVLLLLVLLFMIIVLSWTMYKAKTKTLDVFETGSVFLLFYTLYSLSVPMHVLLVRGSKTDIGLVIEATLLCLIGLIFFLLGYRSKFSTAVVRTLPRLPKQWNPRLVKPAAHAFLILGAVLFLGAIATVGITEYLQAGYAGRALLKRYTGPLELGLYVAQIGLVLYCLYYFTSKRRLAVSITAIYAIYVLFVVSLGIRRPILGLLMATIVAYHYLVRRISFAKGLVLIIGMGVPLLLFAFTRHIITSQGFVAGLRFLLDNFSWAWFDLSVTEFGAPFRSLLDILPIVPEQMGFHGGLSYINAFLLLPPSFMVPDGLATLSEWYTVTFFSPEFIAIGGNMGFFIISEAYFNLGTVGVMITMFLWGIFMRTTYLCFKQAPKSTPYILLYSISLVWIVFALRVDFAVALKGYFYTALLPALAVIIFITGILLKKPAPKAVAVTRTKQQDVEQKT